MGSTCETHLSNLPSLSLSPSLSLRHAALSRKKFSVLENESFFFFSLLACGNKSRVLDPWAGKEAEAEAAARSVIAGGCAGLSIA